MRESQKAKEREAETHTKILQRERGGREGERERGGGREGERESQRARTKTGK